MSIQPGGSKLCGPEGRTATREAQRQPRGTCGRLAVYQHLKQELVVPSHCCQVFCCEAFARPGRIAGFELKPSNLNSKCVLVTSSANAFGAFKNSCGCRSLQGEITLITAPSQAVDSMDCIGQQQQSTGSDSLKSLPIELLIQILSNLPFETRSALHRQAHLKF